VQVSWRAQSLALSLVIRRRYRRYCSAAIRYMASCKFHAHLLFTNVSRSCKMLTCSENCSRAGAANRKRFDGIARVQKRSARILETSASSRLSFCAANFFSPLFAFPRESNLAAFHLVRFKEHHPRHQPVSSADPVVAIPGLMTFARKKVKMHRGST